MMVPASTYGIGCPDSQGSSVKCGCKTKAIFVDDLLNGTNNSKTARDAFVPLQVVEAARRSFESGRIERVLGI